MVNYLSYKVLIWGTILLISFLSIKANSLSLIFSFISGAFILILVSGYYSIKLRQSSPKLHKSYTRRFKFTYPEKWTREIIELQNDSVTIKQPIFPESFLISETVQELIDLIIGEFITPWYSQITSSTLVTEDISLEIKTVVRNLQERLRDLDFAQLLVSNILPLIQEHFESFIHAQEVVRSQGKFNKFDSNEYHLAVISQYRRGKLHPAVTVSSAHEESNFKEKQYLRKKIESILPYLLSKNEKNNEVGVNLVTEILSCTVLCNVFNLLTESDFYNLMIVKLIGDNLRRRDQVKQLRAALEEHTKTNKVPELNESILLSQSTSDLNLQNKLKTKINQQKTTTAKLVLKLNDILFDQNNLKIFKEFMNSRGRLKYVEFWEEVEQIKVPLEGAENEDPLALSLEFGDNDDVIKVFDKYLANGDIPYADSSGVFTKLSNPNEELKTKTYQECRVELFKIQNEVFEEMERTDLPLFNASDVYEKLINQSKSTEINSDVIHAVENAFTQIMSKPNVTDMVDFNGNDDNYDKLLSTIQLKKDIFGDSSNYGSEENLSNRNSRLFDDDLSDEDNSDTDSDSLHSDRPSQNSTILTSSDSEVQFAAPGNLNLAEEIPKLTEQVEDLHRQITVLDPLINKAELTNNVSELKLLQKLKVGMIREINFKELQKQQYIVQENDNSLYGKSKVCIQSYITDNEKSGKEFTLYIIEVQKFSREDPNVIKAGWVVARRFSQFYRLHEYLKSRYNRVGYLKFPKKSISVLKFQQKQVVEIRQRQLEEYLQELIKIQEVCSDKAFRSFLSSENFNLKKNQRFDERKESSHNNNYQLLFGSKWYRGIPIFMNSPKPNNTNLGETVMDLGIMENIKDMETELKQFDESASTKAPFVKPICDLLITVFKLHSSKSWLRGRALVVILQQILGTTVEKKVYDMVESQLKREESILDLVIMLKNLLFPNGKFKDPPVIRSLYQQSNTRQEAKMLMEIFIYDTCSRIFGSHNSIFASNEVFKMLQNDYLNRHLIYEIFDEIIKQLFPEVD
ncbi:hypothetical protein G210_0303 [Candida maltosa Xu316]|uniref:Uncharacterized protein n=1 Tax=Candida maltosa (strain Xu316) TaxID=1245528 RepID=M3JA88_CANMX|nr:hypothetical protein G210_0303 [Candida maltosa Xu316]